MRRAMATLLIALAAGAAVAAPVLGQDRERTPTELWEEYPLEETAPAPETPGGQAPGPTEEGTGAAPGAEPRANRSGGADQADDGNAVLPLAAVGALVLLVAAGALLLRPVRRRRAARAQGDPQDKTSGEVKTPPEGPRDTRRRKPAPAMRPDPVPTPPVAAAGAASREGAAREAVPPRPAVAPTRNGRAEAPPRRPVPPAEGPGRRPGAEASPPESAAERPAPESDDDANAPESADEVTAPKPADDVNAPESADEAKSAAPLGPEPADAGPERRPESKRFSRSAPSGGTPARRASEAGRPSVPSRPSGPRRRLSEAGLPSAPSPPAQAGKKGRPRAEQGGAAAPAGASAPEAGSGVPAARRAVGYTIVPQGDEANSPRLREEARHLQAACKQRGLVLAKLVRDMEAQAGSDLKRPGLAYALERLGAAEFGALVVTRLDRLTRSAANLGALIRLLDERNARLIVVDIELDTRTDEGRLAADALVKVGGLERQKLELRTRKGLDAAREQRHSSGRPAVADRPSLKRRIVEMRAGGMTLQAIADTLNEEGVPTVRGGAEWRPSSVQAAAGYKRPSRRNKPSGGKANKPPGS